MSIVVPNFTQIRGFWWSYWIQNGHHSKPKWSQYGAACLTPCNYPIFLIFILVAILKILKTKSTTLSDDLFLWQNSKGSAVWSEFNIFCTLVTMAKAAILIFSTPQKLPHTTVDIPTKFHERNPNFFLIPPFCFHGNCGKVCTTDSDFFWLISFH